MEQMVSYIEKEYMVFGKGNQRVTAAVKLGYTHIEGIILDEKHNFPDNSFIGGWYMLKKFVII